jgi:hypothetical protein
MTYRHLLYCMFLLCGLLLIEPAIGSSESATHSGFQKNTWNLLETGLEFGAFHAPQELGNATIHVLRIDPVYFEFRLLNASATSSRQLRSAKEWCQEFGLVAAINASMYQQDYLSSISLMRTAGHINNPRLSKDNTVLVFDRRTSEVPLLKIIDRQCEHFDDWKPHYTTFVQSIRMISCKGKNVWRPSSQKWSTAAIAIDNEGRGLFIHVRDPYSTHEVINMLLALPLHISRAMYAEGGREAQLYIRSATQEYEFVGSYGQGFGGRTDNQIATRIPNVIAIDRRER